MSATPTQAAPVKAFAAPQIVFIMKSHGACHPSQTLRQDDACRMHCLGLVLLPTATEPPHHVARGIALPVTLLVEKAPSLWPLHEPHPPRV